MSFDNYHKNQGDFNMFDYLLKKFGLKKEKESEHQESAFEKMERESEEEWRKYKETMGNKDYILKNDFLPNPPDHFKKALEKLGVEFFGPVEGDRLFQKTKLPKGWKKIETDDERFFNLIDENGRLIAEIGYLPYPILKRDAQINLKIPW